MHVKKLFYFHNMSNFVSPKYSYFSPKQCNNKWEYKCVDSPEYPEG